MGNGESGMISRFQKSEHVEEANAIGSPRDSYQDTGIFFQEMPLGSEVLDAFYNAPCLKGKGWTCDRG